MNVSKTTNIRTVYDRQVRVLHNVQCTIQGGNNFQETIDTRDEKKTRCHYMPTLQTFTLFTYIHSRVLNFTEQLTSITSSSSQHGNELFGGQRLQFNSICNLTWLAASSE